MAENVLAPERAYAETCANILAHRRNQFQAVGHRSPSIVDLFPQGTSCRREGIPGYHAVTVRCSNHSAEHLNL